MKSSTPLIALLASALALAPTVLAEPSSSPLNQPHRVLRRRGDFAFPKRQYGSGSVQKDFDSCVSVCQNTAQAALAASASSGGGGGEAAPAKASAGAGGEGQAAANKSLVATKAFEIIVAPKLGDLRFVPFAMSAPVGQEVSFLWGAGPHSVTKSAGSAIGLCNATKNDPFDSGKLNATASFKIKVKDTAPAFYYCTVGQHCLNGMFASINPALVVPSASSSVATWIKNNIVKDEEIKVAQQTVIVVAGSNKAAIEWGGGIDMGAFPEHQRKQVALNVIRTRSFLAENPDKEFPLGESAAATSGTDAGGNNSTSTGTGAGAQADNKNAGTGSGASVRLSVGMMAAFACAAAAFAQVLL